MQSITYQSEETIRVVRGPRLRKAAPAGIQWCRTGPGADPRPEKHLFPIQEDVRYQCLQGGRLIATGSGKTIEISSREIHFTTQHALRVGEGVRLAVAWPARLDGNCLMKLEIRGLVVRCAPGTAAVKIARYEFRTRGASLATIDGQRLRMAASM